MRPVYRIARLAGCVAPLLLVLCAEAAAQAQPAQRVHRIGVLNEAFAANHPTVEGLKAGLRDWGYVEGQNVSYDIRFTRGDPAATKAAAEALVKAGVDLIVTSNEFATLAARTATDRIPVVFTLVGDPVGALVVPSLAQPGGNVTGVSSRAVELGPKRLEMLRMMAPNLRRVWYVFHAADKSDASALDQIRLAAARFNLQLIVRAVANAQELNSALKEIRPGEGVLAPTLDTLDIPMKLAEAARGLRAPSIFPSESFVNFGALMSYGPEMRAQGVQAARLVANVLRGAQPRDLPVERADAVDLSVNLQTAAEAELPVPQRILVRANLVRR